MAYKPSMECFNHLNVYSKSASPLGRLLTNFAYAKINTPDGPFNSVEGYWYWLSIPEGTPGKDRLRYLSGFKAKSRGRELRKQAGKTRFEPKFEEKIRLAVCDKLMHAERKILLLPEGDLPLAHYYVTKNGNVVDVSQKFDWLLHVWEEELALARKNA